jgi:hypothetical protein
LTPGRFALEVTSTTSAIDYGVAWVMVVPEPATWALVAAAAGIMTTWRCRRVRR